jgi:hypothetical protein
LIDARIYLFFTGRKKIACRNYYFYVVSKLSYCTAILTDYLGERNHSRVFFFDEMKNDFEVQEERRFMGLKVHEDGVKRVDFVE